jgi:hypothetical protein
MAENRRILRIVDTRANLQANLQSKQIAIESDNLKSLVYKDGSGTYHICQNQTADFTDKRVAYANSSGETTGDSDFTYTTGTKLLRSTFLVLGTSTTSYTSTAKLDIVTTGTQIYLAYDTASARASITVDSGGILVITPELYDSGWGASRVKILGSLEFGTALTYSPTLIYFGPFGTTGTWAVQVSATDFLIKCEGSGNIAQFTSGKDFYTEAWQDYSATSTITGWDAFTTKFLRYKKVGKLVYVQFDFEGTNGGATTAASFTLPTASDANHKLYFEFGLEQAGAWAGSPGCGALLDSSSTVNLYTTHALGAWSSNTGGKSARGYFIYQSA